jgi:hypothetical protein
MYRRGKEANSTIEEPGVPVPKSKDISRTRTAVRKRDVEQERCFKNSDAGDEAQERYPEDRSFGEGERGTRRGTGNRWVRFLDVALTVPSDESDDELDFCKPNKTAKTNHQSTQRHQH